LPRCVASIKRPERQAKSCKEELVKFIANVSDLAELCRALRGAEILFLDTEFESNRSGTELCLLQVSDGREVFLVDAIAIRDLTPLAAPFESGALWVLHAGQQDVMLLGERLKLRTRPRVFDTQIAWSLSTVEHSVSLAYAQFRALGLRARRHTKPTTGCVAHCPPRSSPTRPQTSNTCPSCIDF